MKRLFVLTMALVLALGTAAMAADINVSATLEANFVFDLDDEISGGVSNNALTFDDITVKAGEEGVWSAEVDLYTGSNTLASLGLGEYKFELTPAEFTATVWGKGYENSSKADPFSFVSSSEFAPADGPKVRVTTDALGFDLTADYAEATGYLFAEGTVEGLTLGGALENTFVKPGADERTVAGWGVYTVDMLTLTGGVGYDFDQAEGTGFGIKGVAEVTDEVTLTAQYVANPDLNDKDAAKYYVKGDYDTDNIEAEAKYDVAVDETVTVSGYATYRQTADVAFDDLFDDYNLLTGYAFKVAASSVNDSTANNKVTFDAYAAAPVAENIWGKVVLAYVADKDLGDLLYEETTPYESKMAFDGVLFFQLTDKISNESTFGYDSYKDVATELALDTTFTYELSDNASIFAELVRSSVTPAGGVATPDTTGTVGFSVSF